MAQSFSNDDSKMLKEECHILGELGLSWADLHPFIELFDRIAKKWENPSFNVHQLAYNSFISNVNTPVIINGEFKELNFYQMMNHKQWAPALNQTRNGYFPDILELLRTFQNSHIKGEKGYSDLEAYIRDIKLIDVNDPEHMIHKIIKLYSKSVKINNHMTLRHIHLDIIIDELSINSDNRDFRIFNFTYCNIDDCYFVKIQLKENYKQLVKNEKPKARKMRGENKTTTSTIPISRPTPKLPENPVVSKSNQEYCVSVEKFMDIAKSCDYNGLTANQNEPFIRNCIKKIRDIGLKENGKLHEDYGWLMNNESWFQQNEDLKPKLFHEKCRISAVQIIYNNLNKDDYSKIRNEIILLAKNYFSCGCTKSNTFGQFVAILELSYALHEEQIYPKVKALKDVKKEINEEIKIKKKEKDKNEFINIEDLIKKIEQKLHLKVKDLYQPGLQNSIEQIKFVDIMQNEQYEEIAKISNLNFETIMEKNYSEFVGAQLIEPYTDHDATVKAIKKLASGYHVKFSNQENFIYHFVKHKKIIEGCNINIRMVNNGELDSALRTYFRMSQQVIQESSIVDSRWEQMSGARTFEFLYFENGRQYMSAVLVSEHGEVILKTFYISKVKVKTNENNDTTPNNKHETVLLNGPYTDFSKRWCLAMKMNNYKDWK